MCNKKVILIMAGILILLVAVVYVRSRISPLIDNYSVEKSEKRSKQNQRWTQKHKKQKSKEK